DSGSAVVIGGGVGPTGGMEGLPALTASLIGMLLVARIISVGTRVQAAICKTAWVTVGGCGQSVTGKEVQSPPVPNGSPPRKLLRDASRAPRPSPAHAAPVPPSHSATPAAARREMVEDLFNARMMWLPPRAATGITLAHRWILANFGLNAMNCNG